jgi:hypothetical protein
MLWTFLSSPDSIYQPVGSAKPAVAKRKTAQLVSSSQFWKSSYRRIFLRVDRLATTHLFERDLKPRVYLSRLETRPVPCWVYEVGSDNIFLTDMVRSAEHAVTVRTLRSLGLEISALAQDTLGHITDHLAGASTVQ